MHTKPSPPWSSEDQVPEPVDGLAVEAKDLPNGPASAEHDPESERELGHRRRVPLLHRQILLVGGVDCPFLAYFRSFL